MFSYLDTLELEHHGIKGQKWGVRRYQNPNGTLTAAGKKRVAKEYKKTAKKLKKIDAEVENLSRYGTPAMAKANDEASALMNRILSGDLGDDIGREMQRVGTAQANAKRGRDALIEKNWERGMKEVDSLRDRLRETKLNSSELRSVVFGKVDKNLMDVYERYEVMSLSRIPMSALRNKKN